MTEPGPRTPTAQPGCPDFEVLSRYTDDELEPDAAGALAAHVAGCARCAALAARLRITDGAAAARPAGGGRGDCVDEERLLLYALGRDESADRTAVAAHLAACDACLTTLALVRTRLAMDVGTLPVPTDVQTRGGVVLEAAMAELAAAAPRRPARIAVLDRWRRVLRAPVLVPAALAATALFAIALRAPIGSRPASGERARAVAPDAGRMRVTAVDATVWSRPSRQSDVLGEVHRGTVLDVAGVERDWYEVRLDGRAGWIEREAFE
jgi:anti-sigma factor RsiW